MTPSTQLKTYACRHIFPDGHRCQSPTLRGPHGPENFCYYHHNSRKPVPKQEVQQRRARCRQFHLNTTDINHPSGIQQAIGEVLQHIALGELDAKRAGLILYGLQTASLNLRSLPTRQAEPTEPVEDIIDDPDHGLIAQEATVEELRPKDEAQLFMEEMGLEIAAAAETKSTPKPNPPKTLRQDTGRGRAKAAPQPPTPNSPASNPQHRPQEGHKPREESRQHDRSPLVQRRDHLRASRPGLR